MDRTRPTLREENEMERDENGMGMGCGAWDGDGRVDFVLLRVDGDAGVGVDEDAS